MKLSRRVRFIGLALAGLVLTCIVIRTGARWSSRMSPPSVEIREGAVQSADGVHMLGRSRVLNVGKLRTVELRGSPEQIGHDHASLLREDLEHVEDVLYTDFKQRLPSGLLRGLLMDWAGFRYRKLPLGYSEQRRRELAGQALGFRDDPFTELFPTYQRLVYLNALYDIALSFERSPLVGCTTFFVDARPRGGSLLLARNFDFDVNRVFDRRKVVFFVHEDGTIPFASVAWPGLVGVVSGVNQRGVAAMAHGARAGPTKTRGEPVVHSLRRVLSHATSARRAVKLLAEGHAMVSHMVIVADQGGDAYAVERLVDSPQHVRPLKGSACVTNHLEGPAKSDPKNLRVLESTSTRARRNRGDALLQEVPKDAAGTAALLRDRKSADGTPLPLGDRRAIDGVLAAHGVIVDFSEGTLWVSEGPHLAGRFVAFDLKSMFEKVQPLPAPRTLPADPLLQDPSYRALLESRN